MDIDELHDEVSFQIDKRKIEKLIDDGELEPEDFKGIEVVNLGAVRHTVIKLRDKYISIMEGENDEMHFGWSKNPDMFPDVDTKDFWTAVPPEKDE